jgi:hypothetical protein
MKQFPARIIRGPFMNHLACDGRASADNCIPGASWIPFALTAAHTHLATGLLRREVRIAEGEGRRIPHEGGRAKTGIPTPRDCRNINRFFEIPTIF